MSDSPDPKSLLQTGSSFDPDTPPEDLDMFVEDADQHFRWRSIPIEGWICLPLFWILAAVVFWQFFTRYALDNSAVWTEEIARQLLILLTFFGAGYAFQTRAHIAITYFILKLTGRSQKLVQEFSCLLQLAFFSYGTVLCVKIAGSMQYQKLMSIDVSRSVVYNAVALGFAGMALRTAIDLIIILKSYRKPPAGPADTSADGKGSQS